ncbi:GNAT family N-acetyltransferase [Thiosulfatimonas sediminis]|uniref:GNAT family N-acetyltransferase n=1 Tax=Thiosulfatimonas sediminis TaxID=2675054 RepID=A0A6F8PS55_9GAMM|nr:GNAT family N-acetyltransferase/peptidase C39 family protein [Thiosulfatimonas sediminis]BBP44864.1 GNAT family N-acetyltransferase [Thiosulfatimonas sediminis]
MLTLRLADKNDLNALVQIEQQCFVYDQISRRSFSHFLKGEHSTLAIIADERQMLGYVLLLFRSGTGLARLYSLAVVPEAQGKGYGKQLLAWGEQYAGEHGCVYLRLEVSVNNLAAYQLYQQRGYKTLAKLSAYYEDGADGWRMEKRLHSKALSRRARPNFAYYEQSTEFTCGPASLMMALQTLQTDYRANRREELQIWREATTIFMTSGHGGCSPHGLALSAWRRALAVELIVNSNGTPFIDGVRSAEKKAVIELVHQDFLTQLAESDVKVRNDWPNTEELDAILARQQPILALISTWQLTRDKAPHWVVITASDENYVYINDPDIDDKQPHLSKTDFEQIPIAKGLFWKMASFGQQKLKALLVLGATAPNS